jgi:hypothetical protein
MTMQHTDSMRSELSPDGVRRKSVILTNAQQALSGRVRVRIARRSLVALALLAASSALVVPFAPRPSRSRPTPLVHHQPTPPARERPTTFTVERLDDSEMLATLAALGVDAGLIEIDGQQTLVARDGTKLDLQSFERRSEGERRHEGGV